MLRIASLAILFLLPALAHATTCTKSPGEAARLFYERHANFVFSGAGSPPLTDELARAVSENIRESEARGEVGRIDWNFWTGAQDGIQSSTAKVEASEVRGNTALVRISYTFGMDGRSKDPRHAELQLSRDRSNCWLISDVRVAGKSLSALLGLPLVRERVAK